MDILFPAAFRDCLTVLHDGVDTRLFHPRGATDRRLPADLGVPDDAEVITFVSRGLEPYHRGFPAFIETLSLLLPARPRLHAVVVGADRVFYGKPAPAGVPYGALVRRRFPTRISNYSCNGQKMTPIVSTLLLLHRQDISTISAIYR